MSTIIAAIDFSNITEPLLAAAINEAQAFKDTLYLIHVAAPDPDFVGYATGPSVVRDQLAEHYHHEHASLKELRTQSENNGCQSKALLLQGPTIEVLVTQAKKLRARLLIVGSHGHGNIHDLLVGSTTKGLIMHAQIPILIIPYLPQDE